MPLTIEMQNAAPILKDDFNVPLIEGAERTFEFPPTLGNFTTTGVVTTDEPASVVDGDPVVLTYTNMTIQSGHIFRPSNRCKGLYLNILGDLIVNGQLTMTARGANAPGKYVGIDPRSSVVYFSDEDIFSEEFPHVDVIHPNGGNGGALVTAVSSGINVHRYISGNIGEVGINNACGGGGAGAAYASHGGTVKSGAGALATSFSGGAGGGGCANDQTSVNGYAGTINGGPGGAGRIARFSGATTARGVGGGAGNPGGVRASTNGGSAESGQNGTGGLLILFVKGNITIGSSGIISSNGTNGGYGVSIGGGGSGAGSIHIYHRGIINDPSKIIANGGIGGSCAGGYLGGSGGNGTINIIQI